ncbi:hypothetical protein SpiGrapes_3082 [Sphaerochaeta pleomorpha str. Grapes]|uniref:Uncharacterized protein n=1 Tax=Sphaerochaeta pleomorpha (strain ATCC BAA-1885 / DSM 22778 / Grapes) TaxID=158190 RepID=G8QYX0_SPHPG|nr:hypothetical protein [Sphaerochaeta pleomorpha]AEV30829.1 hypothetical protein SpiGrapes_3082 [Sphaerochaeta pleomorpha str. Grapes]
MARKVEKCPKCGSSNVIPIAYGEPGPKIWKEQIEGRIILGGCNIFEDSPNVHCKDCKYEWKKQKHWLAMIKPEKY